MLLSFALFWPVVFLGLSLLTRHFVSKVYPCYVVVIIVSYPMVKKYLYFSYLFLAGLLQVELKTRKTCFWRHQKGKPDTFLSTIEAIYYFLVDYHTDVLKEKYKGQYDNLLFFYSFMYQLIKNAKCSGDKETRKITC